MACNQRWALHPSERRRHNRLTFPEPVHKTSCPFLVHLFISFAACVVGFMVPFRCVRLLWWLVNWSCHYYNNFRIHFCFEEKAAHQKAQSTNREPFVALHRVGRVSLWTVFVLALLLRLNDCLATRGIYNPWVSSGRKARINLPPTKEKCSLEQHCPFGIAMPRPLSPGKE